MPDLIIVFARRWKFMLLITLLAMVVAFIVSILSPKKYLSTATALPVNLMVNDRSRIFNPNIQVLYSDFGTPDELDKLEGTAALDTIYQATVSDLNLVDHYKIGAGNESMANATMKLRKNAKISRSAYGELKIKVWDEDRTVAAAAANALLGKLQQLHQKLQNENSILILQRLKQDYAAKQESFRQLSDSATAVSGAMSELLSAKKVAMLQQVQQYENLIDQYQITINSNPQVLLLVEMAKPSLWPDKPKVVPTLLITAFASLAFAFLLAVFLESRTNRS